MIICWKLKIRQNCYEKNFKSKVGTRIQDATHAFCAKLILNDLSCTGKLLIRLDK
jgi:hypothetical protein